MQYQLSRAFFVNLVSPLIGVSLLGWFIYEAIRDPGTDGDQFVVLGAIGLMFASPFAYLYLLGTGLLVQRYIVPTRWFVFLISSVALSLAISACLAVLWQLLLHAISSTELARAGDYLFIPVGGAFAATFVSIPTYLVWGLARRWVAKSHA